MIELWTDGSGTTSGPIGWAYVLRKINDNGEMVAERTACGGCHEGTNNRAEMTALLEGLRALHLPSEVVLFTDSEYVQKAFSEGRLERWRTNGWKKPNGKIKNLDLWQSIWLEARAHRIDARWVEGHAGIELNERCDRLAGAVRRAIIEELKEDDGDD